LEASRDVKVESLSEGETGESAGLAVTVEAIAAGNITE